jgi:hypothetical protein
MFVTLAVLSGLIILFGLAFWQASTNFHKGEKYLRSGNYSMAVLAFEQAVLNHFPGSPYPKRVVKHLFEIGELAYQQKNFPVALQAYHAVLFARASLSVYRNISEEDSQSALDHLNKINPAWINPKIPRYFPNRLWSLAVGFFLLGWIFSIFFLIQRGFTKEGKTIKPALYYPLGSFIITFLLWLLALKNL